MVGILGLFGVYLAKIPGGGNLPTSTSALAIPSMIIDEPVVTPIVLEDRQRAELESVNEKGQVLLSVKNIGKP